ncbi:MAG TPA: hypothetical protein VIX41_11175 [Acidimicrobiales bacterium]
MIRLEPIVATAREWAVERGGWPWNIIGVLPSVDEVERDPAEARSGFAYTVGLDPRFELWCPVHSVEGRGLVVDFLAVILNSLAFATRDDVVHEGDDTFIALGIPGSDGEWERDADAVFWIGEMEPAGRRQTFQSPAPFTLPVLWSSPLGWKEES